MEDKKVIVAGAKLFAAAAGVLLAGFWIVWVATAYLKNRSVLKGDPGRRLAVSNFPAMPLVSGSKHESCSDMLLKVKSGNAANGVVTVRFMHNFK